MDGLIMENPIKKMYDLGEKKLFLGFPPCWFARVQGLQSCTTACFELEGWNESPPWN